MKPLSIGIIVSSGYCIYRDLEEIHFAARAVPYLKRDRFQECYYLTLVVTLWLWVPLYGWNKYFSIRGLISRFFLTKLTESSELSREVPIYTTSREVPIYTTDPMWRFFCAGFFVNLATFAAALLIGLVLVPGAMIVAKLSPAVGQDPRLVSILLLNLLNLAAIILFIFFLKWLIFRFLLVKEPLAIEEKINTAML